MRFHVRLLPFVLSLLSLSLSLATDLGAQSEREVRLPIADGKLSVLALTRAMLDEYGYDGSSVDFRDVKLDIAGAKGSFLLLGISKSLGDTTRLRKSRDGTEVVITVDQVRARVMRQKMKDKFGRAISVLVGHDILARHYALDLPEGLGKDEMFVLCVHGMDSSGRAFDDLRAALAVGEGGIRSGTFTYANDEAIDRVSEELSKRLKRQAQAFPDRPIILVAHSMGGLVSRYMLETGALDPGNVTTLIMLGVPNHGSRLSRLRSGNDLLEFFREQGDKPRALSPWFDGMGEAGWDLWPDSPFLAALNKKPRNPKVTYRLLLGDRGVMTAAELDARREKILKKVRRLKKSAVYEPKIAAWLDDIDEVVHAKGDGAVSLQRGRLQGVQEIVLPVTHTGMLKATRGKQKQPVFEWVKTWVAAAREPR